MGAWGTPFAGGYSANGAGTARQRYRDSGNEIAECLGTDERIRRRLAAERAIRIQALAPGPVACSAAVMVSLGLLVASVRLDQESRSIRFLELRPLVHLGRISYGIYIVHVPLAMFAAPYLNDLIASVGLEREPYRTPAFLLLIFASSVALAATLHHSFERPMARLKLRGASRRTRANKMGTQPA